MIMKSHERSGWHKRVSTIGAAAGMLLLGGGYAMAGKAPPPLEPAELLPVLHQIDQMEIDAGKMAEGQAQAQSVKDYGQKLEQDHQAADDKLKDYAGKNSIDLDKVPASFTDKQPAMHAKMEQIKGLSGSDFDRQFLATMAKDHGDAIKMVDSARTRITDPALKTLIASIEPTLKEHRKTAKKLLGAMGGVAGNDSGSPATVQGRKAATTASSVPKNDNGAPATVQGRKVGTKPGSAPGSDSGQGEAATVQGRKVETTN
jgi:putative membrane protein